MATLNTYLNFKGNTEEAFNFYRSVFGGEFSNVQRFKDTPESSTVSAEDADKLMHIALPIGGHSVLMATDSIGSMAQHFVAGNNFQISIHTDSKAEADKIFNGLSAGGHVTMPLMDTFWGSYFGMFTDKFGIQWLVSFDEVNLPR